MKDLPSRKLLDLVEKMGVQYFPYEDPDRLQSHILNSLLEHYLSTIKETDNIQPPFESEYYSPYNFFTERDFFENPFFAARKEFVGALAIAKANGIDYQFDNEHPIYFSELSKDIFDIGVVGAASTTLTFDYKKGNTYPRWMPILGVFRENDLRSLSKGIGTYLHELAHIGDYVFWDDTQKFQSALGGKLIKNISLDSLRYDPSENTMELQVVPGEIFTPAVDYVYNKIYSQQDKLFRGAFQYPMEWCRKINEDNIDRALKAQEIDDDFDALNDSHMEGVKEYITQLLASEFHAELHRFLLTDPRHR